MKVSTFSFEERAFPCEETEDEKPASDAKRYPLCDWQAMRVS